MYIYNNSILYCNLAKNECHTSLKYFIIYIYISNIYIPAPIKYMSLNNVCIYIYCIFIYLLRIFILDKHFNSERAVINVCPVLNLKIYIIYNV